MEGDDEWDVPCGPEVLAEVFDGEAVVVQLVTGCYYAFDPVATVMWTDVCTARSRTEAEALLGPEQASRFLSYLVSQQLAGVGGVLPEAPADWPGISCFSDMADLLVLDPIHDIDLDGSGWPVVDSRPAAL